MRSFAILLGAALFASLSSALTVESCGGDRAPVSNQCYICPQIKSFYYGGKWLGVNWEFWKYYDTDRICFSGVESFYCKYEKAAYYYGDEPNRKYVPRAFIGRCDYDADGKLITKAIDQYASASSGECPSRAPRDDNCVKQHQKDEEDRKKAEKKKEDEAWKKYQSEPKDVAALACEALLRTYKDLFLTLFRGYERLCFLGPEKAIKMLEKYTADPNFNAPGARKLLAELKELQGQK